MSTPDIVVAGVAAWKRIRDHERRSFFDWLVVGHALAIGKTEALRIAETNAAVGTRYNKAIAIWLTANDLDGVTATERFRVAQCIENLPAIESWLATLPEAKKRRLNYPSAVLARWRRDTREP